MHEGQASWRLSREEVVPTSAFVALDCGLELLAAGVDVDPGRVDRRVAHQLGEVVQRATAAHEQRSVRMT
jgi:hypothetical protein